MGQDPSEIRQDIEDTRQRMGDTVEALSYKTDVRARVGDAVTDKKNAVLGKKDELVNRVVGAAPDPNAVKAGAGDLVSGAQRNAQHAASVAQENPLGLAVGAIALGFLAGMVIPSTSMEDERVGPIADQVKAQAQSTAQEALEHGKQVAQDVVQSAAQTAQQSGQQHGQQLAQSAREDAQSMQETVKSGAGSDAQS
ncbi:MAG TPA: DUF3618 domain-containing protein [Chloroflexota bacterium]|nr:DUF3618 domain-containing protein [Chloroflexota bacterium]